MLMSGAPVRANVRVSTGRSRQEAPPGVASAHLTLGSSIQDHIRRMYSIVKIATDSHSKTSKACLYLSPRRSHFAPKLHTHKLLPSLLASGAQSFRSLPTLRRGLCCFRARSHKKVQVPLQPHRCALVTWLAPHCSASFWA